MNQNHLCFLETDDEFSGLSNMADGFPLLVNGTRIPTSEHLYQCLKFPNNPETQREVLSHENPMTLKMVTRTKLNKTLIRPDWKDIELDVMYFCLKVKMVWNWVKFGDLLRSTRSREIFDVSSRKDLYWGVMITDDGYVGENHLGKLLMKLRDELMEDDNRGLRVAAAPVELGLRLFGDEIRVIDRTRHLKQVGTMKTDEVNQVRP